MSSRDKTFFVYVDYTRETTPRPFYVGKGLRDRVVSVRRNKYHARVAEKYGRYRVTVNKFEKESEAFEMEMQLIRMLGTRDTVGGCNFTDGGEGISGARRSAETIAKISKAQLGKKISEETCAKLSASHIGKKRSPESIAKTAASQRGKKRSPESIAKTSAANTGKKRSPESCAKMSIAQLGRRRSPEAIEKTAAAHRGTHRSPETCAKISAGLRRYLDSLKAGA